MQKVRILFVCLGNICRSPLAEAIFKNKVKLKGWEHFFESDSCGTGNYHIGSQPDPRTIASALKNSVPIDHCARQLSENDLERFDHILAMDASNLKNILSLANAGTFRKKIMLLRDFDLTKKGLEVPDPYFGQEDGFQEVFSILDDAIDNLLVYLEKSYLMDKSS